MAIQNINMVTIPSILTVQIPPMPKPTPSLLKNFRLLPLSFTKSPRNLNRFIGLAKGNNDGLNKEERENSNAQQDLKNDGRPMFNLRWRDLIFNPDPENILAVGLTGVLTWASLQVLVQLFLISLAILVAALKYSLIAALLIFILITLL